MNKPKRKYTLSEKALAANRRNLILAREIDPKIRYRATPKRLKACRANLTRALATLRAASLTPDGESQYKRRSQKPEVGNQSVENRNSKAENRNSKVENRNSKIETSALPPKSQITNQKSQIFYSDSPAYGTRFTRGLYAMSLRRSARLAGEASAAFDEHVQMFRQALAPRNQREVRLGRGIAEIVWRRLRVFSGHARYTRTALIQCLRQAARGPSPEAEHWLTPQDLAGDLGLEIVRIFSTDVDLPAATEKLNRRLERLSRLWVAGRGGDPSLFQYIAPVSVRDGLLAERSSQSMGNPFIAPSDVRALMERPRPCRLHRFSSTDWGVGEPSTPQRPKYGMDPDDGLDIESLEAFHELCSHSWEAIRHNGHTSTSVTVPGHILNHIDSKYQPAQGEPISDRQPSVSLALWSRLELYADLARREADEVQRLLLTKINGQMRDELKERLGALPQGEALETGHDGEAAAFLMELILLFHRAHGEIDAARAPGDSIGAGLHQFLVERFGESAHFNLLEPGYARAVTKAQNERLRRAVEQRLARENSPERQAAARDETPAERLAQAERHLRDVMQLDNLRFGDDADEGMDDLLREPFMPFSTPLPCVGRDREWRARYEAAASAGMLAPLRDSLPSRAQCRARVGLGRKVKQKSKNGN